VALLSLATMIAANAMPKRALIVCNQRGCSEHGSASRTEARRESHISIADINGTVIGGRPSGCPHEFCGCEASLYLFGKIRPELNLASNWIRKFPRTSPAPGMAAAREGHVMVLMKHVSGNDWLVHDGNSGHHLTREHVRSIRGYVIVDPQETMFAKRVKPAPEKKAEPPKQVAAAAPIPLPRKRVGAVAMQQMASPAPKQVADASPAPLPRKRTGAAAIQELAALQIKHTSFPREWMAAVPLEEVPAIPLEHVATVRVDRMAITRKHLPDAPVEHTASITPKQTPALPANRVPMPRMRLASVTPEPKTGAKTVAAIPADRVPMPRVRTAAIAPTQVAAIPAGRVPLPRNRVAPRAPMQVAAIPAERVPLPRERTVSVASVKTLPPRTRVADIQPKPEITPPAESEPLAYDRVADVHLKQAAAAIVVKEPERQDRMVAVPVATAPEQASRHVRTRHARVHEQSIVDRAAGALQDAFGFVKRMLQPKKHHRHS
jgi:hypothetical protein